MRKSIIERFEDKIFYSPDGCWYWIASMVNRPKGKTPYAGFHIKSKLKVASRVSYQIYKGEIGEHGLASFKTLEEARNALWEQCNT